jgi:ankyrin repeat protein
MLVGLAFCARNGEQKTAGVAKDGAKGEATPRTPAEARAALRASGYSLLRDDENLEEFFRGTGLKNAGQIGLALDAGLPPTYVSNGLPLIAIASREGHLDLQRRLLAAGVSPNEPDRSTGMTPLMWACLRRKRDSVRLLLDAGASVNLRDQVGWTALMFSTQSGDAFTVKQLLAAKAEPAMVTEAGWSAPYIATIQKKREILQLLGGQVPGPPPVVEKRALRDLEVRPGVLSFGKVGSGERRTLQVTLALLPQRPPRMVRLHAEPPFSVAPATVNLFSGTPQTVTLFFDAPTRLGRSRGRLDIRDEFSSEMEIFADVEAPATSDVASYVRIQQFLARPGDRASREEFLAKAVWQAARAGDAPVMAALLAAGVDPNVIVEYETPLMIVCKRGDARTAEVLVRGGADVHLRLDRESPWELAEQKSSREEPLGRVMLEAGARE